ncbi:MAG: hypothetical protein BA864_09535 [Desulfuromonadales bacterium C00003093]|nr:MAG: hypothetical protein BA864_09535 [Desulfuromonadales bacterium C00003093]
MEDWRYHIAVEPISLTDNDTDQIDLPSEGKISKMEILVSIDNHATTHEDYGQRRLAEHLTNLSITGDTNDILHDLNGSQSRMFAMDTEQNIPPEEFRGYNNVEQNTVIPVYFGRYGRDHDFGLDLSKWTNVRLAITNDFDAARFVPGSAELSIRFLWTFDDEINPAAYLAKTIVDEQAVPTANMWTTPVILPKRYPIRRIGVEGFIPTLTTSAHEGEPKATLATSLTDIKFTKRARKDMIWHDTLAQLFRWNEDEYGHHRVESYMDHGSATPLWTDTMLGELENLVNQDYHTGTMANTTVQKVSDLDWARHHHLWQWGDAAAQALVAHGRGYNSTGLFRFYTYTPREIHGDYVENWLQPGRAEDGVCELMYQLGSTDVRARTLIEQAIPHPET